jgi:hypothetical protein
MVVPLKTVLLSVRIFLLENSNQIIMLNNEMISKIKDDIAVCESLQ